MEIWKALVKEAYKKILRMENVKFLVNKFQTRWCFLFFPIWILVSCKTHLDLDVNHLLDSIKKDSIIGKVVSFDSTITNDSTHVSRKIKVIAHRGHWNIKGSAQNSLFAVKSAYENKFDGVEIDVRISKDTIVYLNHDEGFRGYKLIHTRSTILDQLILSNGERLPRFEDFINLIKDYVNFAFYIEIKESGNPAMDKELVSQVLKKLEMTRVQGEIYIISFGLNILKVSKEINPRIRTLFIAQNHGKLNYEQLKAAKVDIIGLNYLSINQNKQILNDIKKNGYELNLWTVNNLEIAQSYKGSNLLSSITTDDPTSLKEIFK